jgi:hypothetical protein
MSVMTPTRGDIVAKKRGGRPKKPGGEGRHMRLRPSIVTMAKVIADARGIATTDYLSDLLQPLVSRDYVREIERLKKEGGVG